MTLRKRTVLWKKLVLHVTLCDLMWPYVTLCDLNESDVKKVFSRLDVNKATGADGIANIVIKKCSHQLSEVFKTIFQMTFR